VVEQQMSTKTASRSGSLVVRTSSVRVGCSHLIAFVDTTSTHLTSFIVHMSRAHVVRFVSHAASSVRDSGPFKSPPRRSLTIDVDSSSSARMQEEEVTRCAFTHRFQVRRQCGMEGSIEGMERAKRSRSR
jgi:hypothetical protein